MDVTMVAVRLLGDTVLSFSWYDDENATVYGGVDFQMMLPVDVIVDGVIHNDVELEVQATIVSLDPLLDYFDVEDSISLRVSRSTLNSYQYFPQPLPLIPILNANTPSFSYSPLSFSYAHSPLHWSTRTTPPFSPLTLSASESSFFTSAQQLHACFYSLIPFLFHFPSLHSLTHDPAIIAPFRFEDSFFMVSFTFSLPTTNSSLPFPSCLNLDFSMAFLPNFYLCCNIFHIHHHSTFPNFPLSQHRQPPY